MICASCGRDIAVPRSLIAERDELLRKRDILRQELSAVSTELEKFRRGKMHRSA